MPSPSSQLTCVVAVTGWYADKALSATPNTNPCIPVIPTRWATTQNSRFLSSLQESGLASRGSDASEGGGCDAVCQYFTGPTNLGHAVVPMLTCLRGAEEGSESKAVNLVVADLEVLSATKVGSLITSVADYVLVVDVGHAAKNDEAAHKKRLLWLTNTVLPSAIAARATILGLVSEGGRGLTHEILRKAADQSEGLPYHHVEVGEDVSPDHIVRAVLPGLLFDALPKPSCFPPARADVLPAERVLRFLDQRSDCTAGESASTCMQHAAVNDDDVVLHGGGLDVVVGSLMPVLKINYQLRASLPFRCVLVSHFSLRQVALVYIVQGMLRCGESLMSANLHLMGVLGDETPNVINWSALRQDCRVETMSRYPIPNPMVGEDDVALPGEFVTLQLQRGMRHVQATTVVPDEPSTVVSAPQPTKKPRATKAAPSGCFLENLSTWSICGKLPAMNGGKESVDTVFPRPFAVAQWSLSNVYREPHSSALPSPLFDTKTSAYTGGTQHLANATVVGGEAHILSITPHVLDEAGNIVSLNVADQSSEATFDTHVHLLDPRMPFPERRALLVFSDHSVVVRTTIIQRKLTLLMAAAAGAVRALGPPLPSSLRTVEDVVECIGIRAGTKAPLPVGDVVQKMVWEAAGHELAYHLPTGLLVELGVFDASRFVTEGSTIYDALMHPQFLSNVPSEADIRSGRFVISKGTMTQEAPTPPAPAPIGVWALLAMSYHSYCEQGYKVDAIRMSQSLRSATKWAQSISSTSNPYLMYMMARPKGVKRVGPSQCHIRAAMGPSFLFNLSSHTRHLWNKYVGDTVPFETVWRAVLPRLLSEWNAGSTYTPILWLRMLFNSCLALDMSRSDDVGFNDCCQVLLQSSRQPSQEALVQMIMLKGRYEAETKLPAYTRRRTWQLPIAGSTMISPLITLYPSDIYTGGGMAACGVSDPIIGLLYEWYAAVGGVRALGAPLFERIQLDDKFGGRPPYNFTQAQLKGHHLYSSVIPRQMPIQVPRKPFTLEALNAARANGLVDKAPDENSRTFALVSLVQLHLYLAAAATKPSYAALTADAVATIADYLP